MSLSYTWSTREESIHGETNGFYSILSLICIAATIKWEQISYGLKVFWDFSVLPAFVEMVLTVV